MKTLTPATATIPATVYEWLYTLTPRDRADMEKVLAAVSTEPGPLGWQDTYEDWVYYDGLIDTGDYADIGHAVSGEQVQVTLIHDPDEGWTGFQAEAEVDQGAFLLVQFRDMSDLELKIGRAHV